MVAVKLPGIMSGSITFAKNLYWVRLPKVILLLDFKDSIKWGNKLSFKSNNLIIWIKFLVLITLTLIDYIKTNAKTLCTKITTIVRLI